MPGARCARSRVRSVESTRVSHHGHTGTTRHSPRNGFNGFLRALPGDRAFLPPSPLRSLLLKNLTPASGRQDHTTSPSALRAFRLEASKRPPHPALNVRDDRDTSLFRGGMPRNLRLIWGSRQCRRVATDWHDGQFAHDRYEPRARLTFGLPTLAARRMS